MCSEIYLFNETTTLRLKERKANGTFTTIIMFICSKVYYYRRKKKKNQKIRNYIFEHTKRERYIELVRTKLM